MYLSFQVLKYISLFILKSKNKILIYFLFFRLIKVLKVIKFKSSKVQKVNYNN